MSDKEKWLDGELWSFLRAAATPQVTPTECEFLRQQVERLEKRIAAHDYPEENALMGCNNLATPQVTPTGGYFCFECDDKNRCASAETCYAGHSGYPRRTIEGTSEQASQVTPRFSEHYGRCDYSSMPHAKDSKMGECGPCKNWKSLAEGTSEQASPTPEASPAKCRSPYHRPTSMFCLDCIPPDAPISVLLLSNRQPTEEETKRGLDIAKLMEYDAFWRELTLKGDPLFVPNKFRTGFNAGFAAGMRAGEIAMREKAATRAAEFYWAKGDALDVARAIRELAISGAEESKK